MESLPIIMGRDDYSDVDSVQSDEQINEFSHVHLELGEINPIN